MASLDPILVLGGCGTLGHHLVRALFSSGATNITVYDINISTSTVPHAKYIRGTIQSPSAVLHLLQTTQPRTIFHTVSPSMLGQRNTKQTFHAVNVTGTKNVLAAIAQVRCTKALVYTSSSSVIHNNRTDLVAATETEKYCPEAEQTVYYTTTKAEAERLVLGANRSNGLLTAVIRGCTLFGENDNVMPVQIGNARAGRGRLQVGNGENMYDWTYVGNTADAHVLAAEKLVRIDADIPPRPEDADMRIDGEAFVITNDEPWPFWDFVRAVGAQAGYPVKKEDVWVAPAWAFYVMAVVAEWGVWAWSGGRKESKLNRQMVKYLTMTRTFDITKAKKRLGYRAKVSIEGGIRRAVESYVAKEADKVKKDH